MMNVPAPMTSLTFLCSLSLSVLAPGVARSETSREIHEVLTVSPSQQIEHEVDLKGRFDEEVVETFLEGPKFFSQSVRVEESSEEAPKSYLCWYRIDRPTQQPSRKLSLRGPLLGSADVEITIEAAAYLLSPAQTLTSGKPSSVPESLSHFQAFRIVKCPPLSQELKLLDSLGPGDRAVARAVYLCIPVEEWHHGQHFPIKKSDDCLLVFETSTHQVAGSFATIDQFGLNKLAAEATRLLAAPVKLVSSTEAN